HGDALLWFNRATEANPSPDSHAVDPNTTRFASWIDQHPIPVHAFVVDFKPRRVRLHPSKDWIIVEEVSADTGESRSMAIIHVSGGVEVDLSGIEGSPEMAVWNEAGNRIAIATADGMVQVLAFPSMEPAFRGQAGREILTLAFSPDGTHFASGSKDHATLYNLAASETLTLPNEPEDGGVSNLAFSPDSHMLVSVGRRNGRCQRFLLSDPGVPVRSPTKMYHISDSSPIFIDGGQGLFTFSNRRELTWWQAREGTPLKTMAFPHGDAEYAILDARERYLAVTGFNRTAVWRTDQIRNHANGPADPFVPEEAARFQHGDIIKGVGFHPRYSLAISGSMDRKATIWSSSSGTRYLNLPHERGIRALCVGPDGSTFITAQSGGLIRVWRSPPPRDRLFPSPVTEYRIVVSPDERHCLAVGNWGWARTSRSRKPGNHRLRLTEIASGKRAGPVLSERAYVNNACFSPSGNHLAVLTSDPNRTTVPGDWQSREGEVRLWDMESETLSGTLTTPSEPIDGVFDPKDEGVLTVICAGGQLLRVGMTGHILGSGLAGEKAPIHQQATKWIRTTTDGTTLITGVEKSLVVFEASTLEVRARIEVTDGSIRGLDISSDQQRVAVCSFGTRDQVRILDLITGRDAYAPLHHPDWVFSARFAEDDRVLVTTCRDGTARIWDLDRGELLHSFAHEDQVSDAQLIGNGRCLATTVRDGNNGDGFVRVWEVATGRQILPDKPLTGWFPVQLHLLDNGRRALTDGLLGSLHLLDFGPIFETPFADLEQGERQGMAEILASKRQQGAALVNFTTEEWYQRWQELRELKSLRFWFE
ncbi:MAG: WD40 repeat domain-containing protein, partial [Verrucomicrobiota bacterium]